MSEIQRKIDPDSKRQAPVMIICPEPGFKSSFFDKHGMNKAGKNFFWNHNVEPQAMKKFENEFMAAYMNMSYILGTDYNISVVL